MKSIFRAWTANWDRLLVPIPNHVNQSEHSIALNWPSFPSLPQRLEVWASRALQLVIARPSETRTQLNVVLDASGTCRRAVALLQGSPLLARHHKCLVHSSRCWHRVSPQDLNQIELTFISCLSSFLFLAFGCRNAASYSPVCQLSKQSTSPSSTMRSRKPMWIKFN
jgi:hypothetical protein